MTGLVISERCQGPCGKQVPPSKLVTWGPHVKICQDCWARHSEAMALLSRGAPPKECQNCHLSLEQMKRMAPDGEPSFVMHNLDGVYVALCEGCDAQVQYLQRHMYRNTPHGVVHKLI